MKPKFLAILAFVCLASIARAQTLVSGSFADANGTPYSGATLTITQTTASGKTFTVAPAPPPLRSDGTYAYTIDAVSGSTYTFTVTSSGVNPPAGYGSQTCSVSGVTISGSTQTVSSSSCPTILRAGGGAPSGPAGGDLGSTYPNPIVKATHLATALPASQGGTDVTNPATGDMLVGNAASWSLLGPGSASQVLGSTGTTEQWRAVTGSGAAISTGPTATTPGDCVKFADTAGTLAGNGSACGDSVTSNLVYYVCSQANGTTCSSPDTTNGWNANATVSATISDSNNCTSVATPCRTVPGAISKYNPATLQGATVTIYIASAANTGTDCQSPANVTIPVGSFGRMPIHEGVRLDSYPSSMLVIHGDLTNSADAPIYATCGSTTQAQENAYDFDGAGSVLIEGVQFAGYGHAGTNDYVGVGTGPIVATGGAVVYTYNVAGIGDSADTGMKNTYLESAGPGSYIVQSGSQTVSGGMGIADTNGGFVFTYGPSDTATAPTAPHETCASGLNCAYAYFSIFDGHIWTDRWNPLASGPGTWSWFGVQLGGHINAVEVYGANGATDCNWAGAGVCTSVTLDGTLSAANFHWAYLYENSFIDSDCDNSSSFSCTATTQPSVVAVVQQDSLYRYYFSTPFTGSYTIITGGCTLFFTPDFTNVKKCDSFDPAVNNRLYLTANWTDSNGTTNLQTIPFNTTFNAMAGFAQNINFTCHLSYSQATGAVSDYFGIQVATNAPTSVDADGWMNTSGTVQQYQHLAGLNTITATNIVSATPSATGTIYGVILSGLIQIPAANTTQSQINIMVGQSTAANQMTIYKGSQCDFNL